MIIEDLGRIPMSQHLAATLARAASYADAQQHASVTLEHLLLALAEDPDASVVLRSSNVDLARLAGEVSTHIGRIEDRRDPNAPGQVLISPDLKRILEAKAGDQRGHRSGGHRRRRQEHGCEPAAHSRSNVRTGDQSLATSCFGAAHGTRAATGWFSFIRYDGRHSGQRSRARSVAIGAGPAQAIARASAACACAIIIAWSADQS
jgi:hypothetical protein